MAMDGGGWRKIDADADADAASPPLSPLLSCPTLLNRYATGTGPGTAIAL